jgi:hypothetical protein
MPVSQAQIMTRIGAIGNFGLVAKSEMNTISIAWNVKRNNVKR